MGTQRGSHAAWLLLGLAAVSLAATGGTYHLDVGPGPVAPGYLPLTAEMSYDADRGYGFLQAEGLMGFESADANALHDGLSATQPVYLSLKVPEGNHRVTLTLGHPVQAGDITVKAELRRLMLARIRTAPGQFRRETFIVNVRRPQFPGGEVHLKGRERTQEAWAWDDQLTLEINGTAPCLCAVDVEPAPAVPTLFLIGDSTVCDQSAAPWNSWGQMITRFFRPTIAVANHAESGESIRGSLGARRFDKIYSLLRPGDFVMIQFGHNDMKDRRPDASAVYKDNLKAIVARIRELGATPILVTSMERSSGVERDTLADYPDKVRQVAAEDHVALIDLHRQSKILYRALGDHLMDAFQDGTHHNNYGSTLLALCVVQALRDGNLELARYLRDDVPPFDPADPPSAESYRVPVSPKVSEVKPLGD